MYSKTKLLKSQYLDFLNTSLRLQLFHLQMSQTAQAIEAGMSKGVNYTDRGSIGHTMASLGIDWFSNDKKKIIRAGGYERHSQHLRAYQIKLLLNTFNNFILKNPSELDSVKDSKSAIKFVARMLKYYGMQWFYDPSFNDSFGEMADDLFLYSRDQVIRLVLDLAFRQCGRENDALGLRALRRIMGIYFLNKGPTQSSSYARFVLTDLVVEASASERSRTRMDHLVTVNPTGSRGGGMFRDMFNEVMVRLVKEALKRQHSILKDLQVKTLVTSLSVMTSLHQFNLDSRLCAPIKKTDSYDTVGEERGQLMEELVNGCDPFNLDRDKVTFVEKSSRSLLGSPFAGVEEKDVKRFVNRVKTKFMLLYPDM